MSVDPLAANVLLNLYGLTKSINSTAFQYIIQPTFSSSNFSHFMKQAHTNIRTPAAKTNA